MGKGLILSHIGDAQYSVQVKFDDGSYTANLARLQDQIDYYTDIIDDLPEGEEKEEYKLLRTAAEKRKETLITSFPGDPIVTAWCTDKTEDLAGNIGLCEVTGDRQEIIIQPGYDDNAVYNQTRDGQIRPAAGCSPAELYYNLAMLPGWQKWKPTFRIGTIVAGSIDTEANTCSVCLIPAFSQKQNLGVNQSAGYGSCEADAVSGFVDFCSNNPAHPLCTVSSEPANALTLTDQVLSDLQTVNSDVNDNHDYKADVGGYLEGESWDIMGPGDTGDCEDFALTKADDLIALGYDPAQLRMATGYTETGGYHAVLMIETSGGTYVLDNRNSLPMLTDRLPYRWDKRQKAGLLWEKYSVLLEDVPVEYMGTGAGTFRDGDEVLVEFQSQDFNNPKVIGYRTNPRGKRYIVIRSRTLHRYTEELYGPDAVTVYDLANDRVATDIPDGGGGFLSFPCDYSDTSYWRDLTASVGVEDSLVKTPVGNSYHWEDCEMEGGLCCGTNPENYQNKKSGECSVNESYPNDYQGTDLTDYYQAVECGPSPPDVPNRCCFYNSTVERYHHVATYGLIGLADADYNNDVYSYGIDIGGESKDVTVALDYESTIDLTVVDIGDPICPGGTYESLSELQSIYAWNVTTPYGAHETVELDTQHHALIRKRQNVHGKRWSTGEAIFISGISYRFYDSPNYGTFHSDVHAAIAETNEDAIFSQSRNGDLEAAIESLLGAAFVTGYLIDYGYADLSFDLRE